MSPLVMDDILVLSVRKSFWASKECLVFPHRFYAMKFFGHSSHGLNAFASFLKFIFKILFMKHKPKLIFFGSIGKVVPWFVFLKRVGIFKKTRFLVSNRNYLTDSDIKSIEKIIIFCRSKIKRYSLPVQDKCQFIPLPADMRDPEWPSSIEAKRPYVFSGGGSMRDYDSVIQAMRGVDMDLRIVVFHPESIVIPGDLKNQCFVHGLMSLENYLGLMKEAQMVVLPLKSGTDSHGHTTLVQALSLHKAIISTQDASIDDYMADGQEGILVPAGDIAAYKRAIQTMSQDIKLRKHCELKAALRSEDLTYDKYSKRCLQLCRELMQETLSKAHYATA